ncbi:prenyltransferase/squalene oxidase repeat-containing protein [Kitasatospora sp. NPDC059088]|uniref:LPXTG cell wall anchor domain-containing protein n=1 Tax=Kitasatospora sp. NPDC059088 TaxID=3346722 RepID=UPI0036D0172F
MRVSSSRTRHRNRDLASLVVAGAVAVAACGTVLLGHPESAAARPTIPALTGADLTTARHDADGPTATPTPPAGRKPDAAKGSAYLTDPSRLTDGHYYEGFPAFADFGLTIDGAYALAATGTDDAALRRIVDFLDQQGKDASARTVNDWTAIGTEYAGGGSIGKEALLAEAVGRNPRNFGGHDLIAALAAMVCTKADAGTGCDAPGNYTYATSVFSQALAVMAQLRAGESTGAAPAIGYLRSLQHPDGSWPSLIPAAGDSDVDSTAMAVMALALVPGDEAAQAVDKGLGWLAARQLPDGGFPGAAGNSTNSAALAVQGMTLRKAAYGGQIAKALDFLAGQQNGDGGFNVASTGQRGSDVRASTQVLGGATGISFGTLSRDLGGSPTPTGTPSTTPSGTPTPTSTVTPTGTPSTTPSGTPTPTGTSTPTTTSTGTPTGSPTTTGPGPTTGAPSSGGVDAPTDGGAEAAGGVPVQTGSDHLASTGTQALALTAAAGALTALGAAAVIVARRRRTAAPGRHR